MPDHFTGVPGHVFLVLLPSLSHVSAHRRIDPINRHFQAVCLLGIRIVLKYWILIGLRGSAFNGTYRSSTTRIAFWTASPVLERLRMPSCDKFNPCLRSFGTRVFLPCDVQHMPVPAGGDEAIAIGTIAFDDTVILLVTDLSKVAYR